MALRIANLRLMNFTKVVKLNYVALCAEHNDFKLHAFLSP